MLYIFYPHPGAYGSTFLDQGIWRKIIQMYFHSKVTRGKATSLLSGLSLSPID